jgi:hypothetical protein
VSTRRSRRGRAAAVLLGLVLLATGCSAPVTDHARRGTTAAQSEFSWSGPRGATVIPAMAKPAYIAPYEHAVRVAADQGLQVWLESDLAKRWRAGKESFREGVQRLGDLAVDRSVVGFKIADELGYRDGFDGHADAVAAFLHDARRSLAAVAPGRKILVDFAVPALGCAPGLNLGYSPRACLGEAQARYPALALSALDHYIGSGDIDVVSLSTFLQSPVTYTYWGTSTEEVQRDAWHVVQERGWGRTVQVQARKALAQPGGFSGGKDGSSVEETVELYGAVPLRSGASAVHIWAWRQEYQNRVVSLVGPDLKPNPLWRALRSRHDAGAVLETTFSPRQVHRSVEADLKMIAQVFTGVIIAAGTG